MRLLVIVPAFNEEAALAPLLDELTRTLPSLPDIEARAVVIDDGSSDRTAEIARAQGTRVVQLCRNLGIGGTVQTGIRLAFREGFDSAVQMDGDGQHPPGEIHKLVAPLRATPPPDIVIGTRYIDHEGFNSTALRRFGALWLKCLIRALTGVTISDPTSGYRVYGPRALRLFDRNYPYDYPEPEALVIALAAGLSIVEVPVVMRERQGGASSIFGWRVPYYMLKVTLAVLLAFARNVRRRGKEEHAV
jgi:glycosyltransferase involved in cell wall biosynthesis